jgi:uncharacterized protein YbjT (DUF2867 family)
VNVFLAGATGAVGRRLSLLLLADGHAVTGTTRSRAKEAQLRSDGVTPVVADVFDSQALRDAVVRAKPEIVIHELTDLAGLLEPGRRTRCWRATRACALKAPPILSPPLQPRVRAA